MLKSKYLHRRVRKPKNSWDVWYYKYKRKNYNINNIENLPKHEPMGKDCYRSGCDFSPLMEFLETKIGCDWDDVYSEIIKKCKKKYRYFLHYYDWLPYIPIYDKNFIPRNRYGRILTDCIFIDINNKVSKKTEQEILIDSKKYVRREKIKKMLENIENEETEDNI